MMKNITQYDTDILRRLAERKLCISHDPMNQERKRAWYALDAGKDDRVMVLAEHHGIRDGKKPVPDDVLGCADDWARSVEKDLRAEIYRFEILKDDHVVEAVINTNWKVSKSDYGVEVVMHYGGDENLMGSRIWDPPIKDLNRDLSLLHHRTFAIDRKATLAERERLETVFDGILPVRIRGSHYWTMGLTWTAIELVGLEKFMIYMYDNPAGLHRLMDFLRKDHLEIAGWIEEEGLYSLNNENDYIGSGSIGYTSDLPKRNLEPGARIGTEDLWVLLESQETVGVGPEQFEEFIFPYQLDIAERFGKTYYGCCEPINNRWHIIKRIPNLARVSVSPWADQSFMADALGRDLVFSRKPNPAMISTGVFDEDNIRADLRETLSIARDCRLEIIMKDVHTLNNEPDRLPRWVQLAREEIAKSN